MIQTDVIHEEKYENDSIDGESRHRDSSDDGGNEEDFLDA